MTAIPDPAEVAEVAAITADFPPWHAYLSRTEPDAGPPRVWAARARPTHPHVHADPLTSRFTGSGETVDADTPGQMRDLLAARCGS
jgi:hypothetical protein